MVHTFIVMVLLSISAIPHLIAETSHYEQARIPLTITKPLPDLKNVPRKKGFGFFSLFKQAQPLPTTIIIDKDLTQYLKSDYNEWTFLTAHNAHANKKSGWWYRQQNLDITELLDYGVRGLMLDVHPYKNDAYLCHGDCSTLATVTQRSFIEGIKSWMGLKTEYKTLKEILLLVKRWLEKEKNRYEVVTIFLENYVDDSIIESILKESLHATIFNPEDLVTFKKEHPTKAWPSLQTLCDLKKRIIVFNEKKRGSGLTFADKPLFFSSFDHIIESQFGTTFDKDHGIDLSIICKQRSESYDKNDTKRSLYTFNFFSYPSKQSDAKINNSYNNLMHAITLCFNNNSAPGSPYVCSLKKPNFLALDFVDIGDGKKVVDYLHNASLDDIKEWSSSRASSTTLSVWARGFNQLSTLYKTFLTKK